ncbi:Fructose-bisphosphate aldolase class 1 [Roseimaritima multifibrata]|uniref:Probable fructose-bisphosphate aldolase class 1 n=1 Tax=Roseimaritima multifibrata TaxID=1930274 RepID=A0A517MHL9_9BACT|nr:class I fructose-bisphosphate aldolase [Roseimaritima multifibrata]QDS94373.1 Fructose-bisphosphate aldolase class 1 [Roseimaritima multifibrata]
MHDQLSETTSALLVDGKGILAMDESTPTCNKRFKSLGIPQNEEMRRAYREMIITTPGLGQSISGAILFDETLRESSSSGESFVKLLIEQGIVPGIKVDKGTVPLAGHDGETVTEGLDGLRQRLSEYAQLGAKFAKWRAVIAIDDDLPTAGAVEANAHALARYAALCQEVGLVPIVEPEVLMHGHHSILRCGEVTEMVQREVFVQLNRQQVTLETMILKPNMVAPALDYEAQTSDAAIADATVQCLMRTVPAAVAGIAFLSGGQDPEHATARLAEMNARYKTTAPWPLTFSFGRAIQRPALECWLGEKANVPAARALLLERAEANAKARCANTQHEVAKI